MLTGTSILILIAALVPILLMAYLFYRLNRNQLRHVNELQDRLFDFQGKPDESARLEARVLEKKETISPKAPTIARVDLSLEIRPPDQPAYTAETTWLVELTALERVEAGCSVPVLIDLRKGGRIYPDFPGAKAWVF